jgi:hypothetical protein
VEASLIDARAGKPGRDAAQPSPPPDGPSQPESATGAASSRETPQSATDLTTARALADAGELDAARELCLRVRDRNLLDPQPHLLLAVICQEQHDLAGAVAALKRVIYLAPDSQAAHFRLGQLLLQMGERRGGRRAMATVMRLAEANEAGVDPENDVSREDLVAAARAALGTPE